MTREEAINIYQGLINPRIKEAFEFFAPELAESEDERIRKGLIKLLTVASDAYLVDSTGIKKDSYLAYLEKQKEQKPEWSEDDEEMMTDIIESLEYAYPNDNEFRIAWLKSLRPQPRWKPSEGEMKALQNAVALTACDKELTRLYNQLKKLM